MTTLIVNQLALISLSAAGASNEIEPAAFSAQVDDYSTAYVAWDANGKNLEVVPKKPGTVTVTVNGHSQDGTALPAQTRQYQINPVPVPQATHFLLGADNLLSINSAQPDPGTGTVTGNV